MAENTQDLANQGATGTADVLTLHHAIAARWVDERSLSQRTASAFDASSGRHSDWIGGLHGLASLGGSFGPQAWNIASELATAPQLLQRLSPAMRALQVGELADLVQIILEEEENSAELADLEQQVAATTAARSNAAQAGKQAAKARAGGKSAAVQASRPAAAAKKAAAPKKSAAVQGKLRELRRLLTQLRSSADTAASGASMPQRAGDVGPLSPDAAIAQAAPDSAARSQASAPASAWQDVPAGGALAAMLARSAAGNPVKGAAVRAGQMGATAPAGSTPSQRAMALNPWAAVAQVQAELPSRALRMAEAAADMGFVNLAPDATDVAAFDGATATAAPRSATLVAARPAPVAHAAGTAQVATTAAQLPTPARQAPQVAALAASTRQASQVSQAAGFAAAQRQWLGQAPAAFVPAAQAVRGHVAAPAQVVAPALAPAGVAQPAAAGKGARSGKGRQIAQTATQVSAPPATGVAPAPVSPAAAPAPTVQAGRMAAAQPVAGRATLALQGMVSLARQTWLRGERAASLAIRARAAGQPVPSQLAASSEPASAWLRWADAAMQAYSGTAPTAAAAGSVSAGNRAGRESVLAGTSPDRPMLELGAEAEVATEVSEVAARMGQRSAASALPAWLAPRAAQQAQRQAQAQARNLPVSAQVSAAAADGSPAASFVSSPTPAMRGLAAAQAAAGTAQGGPVAAPVGATSALASSILARAGSRATVAAELPTVRARLGLPGLIGAVADGLGARVAGRTGMQESGVDLGWSKLAAPVATSGDVGREAPGEWLDTSADVPDTAAAETVTGAATAAPARRAAQAQSAAATPRVAAAVATVAPASKSVGMGQTPAIAAAARAIDFLRGRMHSQIAPTQPGHGVVDQVAGLGDQGLLAVRPLGRADALSQWMRPAAERQAVPDRSESAGELLGLVDEVEAAGEAAQAPSAGAAPRTTTAREVAGKSRATAAAAKRMVAGTAQASRQARQAAAPIASLGLQNPTPRALRAILEALGESVPGGASDVATAFAAKWLGRADVARQVLAKASREAAVGDLLSTADMSDSAAEFTQGGAADSTGVRRATRSSATKLGTAAAPAVTDLLARKSSDPVTVAADGDGMVLTGLAALAALSSGDLFGAKAATRTMRAPEAEQTLLEPAPDAAPAADVAGGALAAKSGAVSRETGAGSRESGAGSRESSAVSREAAGASRKLAAVKVHEFTPVGLGRGRNLLGQQRRAAWLSRSNRGLHTTPKGNVHATIQSLTRMAAQRSERRFGYGTAALGGGELLGLTGGVGSEGDLFFGEMAPTTGAARGADRLSQSVLARRHASASGAAPQAQRAMQLPDFDGAPVIPSNFSAGDAGATVHSMADAVAASGRRGGATAAGQGAQAAAMTRVLSVTSSPGGNVLPLVAPAAQAVVAAAAKPLSESIVTSGADPSLGVPIVGVGDHKAGKASSGGDGGGQKARDGADEHAANVQDIEALAMKIARAVMVRIKRERERRGLHV
ncbi:MAG: hypothetical protein HY902_02820 [Deltaproteobacteria bacterium]|nr:hypothetical protein [Deltaproteobacteria bacterium]